MLKPQSGARPAPQGRAASGYHRKKLSNLAWLIASAVTLQAQAPSPQQNWTWTADANAFAGYNYQDRRFVDFSAWESQNWFMLTGGRPIGAGHLSVRGMISLEPFTIHALGSPQVFQTGESYRGSPLIDYQHPHDLFMGLGATYRISRGRVTYFGGADLVGAPALGPTSFMHRDSARDNPQAPLVHHQLDSTHITPGVVRAGVEIDGLSLEGSWFRGEEPNENRLNIDRPRLDSWSTRVRWRGGPWDAQISGGRLHRPEWFDPFDVTRLTASLAFTGAIAARPLAATIAWGQNREVHGTRDGYLFEFDLRVTAADTVYGRCENVAKDIFALAGPVEPDEHRVPPSRVSALTLGYVRDVLHHTWGRIGIGADATVYHLSQDLGALYGAPRTFHAFVRYRPRREAPSSHVH